MRTFPLEGLMYVLFGVVFVLLPFMTSLYNDKAIVATKYVEEEPFKESVIYVYKHNFYNAFGLLLNKPLTSEQRAELPAQIRDIEHIYYGGIIDFPNALTLARIESKSDGVHLEIESLKRAMRDNPKIIDEIKEQGAAGHLRLYAGYLGWGFLQLDREAFAENAWSGLHLNRDIIYTPDPYEMWKKATNNSRNKWQASGI